MTDASFDDVNDPETLLGVLAGAVSLCWEPRPTGVFDSAAASEFVEAAIVRFRVLVSDTAIRADEAKRMNERWRTQVLDNERGRMRLDLLADFRAKVEALRAEDPHNQPVRGAYDAVLALIDGGNQ